MLESPLTVLAYTSAWSLGFIFLRLIRFDGTRLETACASLLSGLFFQSWFSFLLGLAGAPLTREVFVAVDVVLTSFATLLLFAGIDLRITPSVTKQLSLQILRRFAPQNDIKNVILSRPAGRQAAKDLRTVWFLKISLSVLFVYFLMHAVINAERVISFTDAVMSYDFRARAMAYEGKVHTSVYGWPEVQTPNFMYPPLITQFNAHYYALGGKNPKLIYSLLLLAASGLTGACVFKISKSKIVFVLSASLFAFLPVVRKYSLLEALDFPALSFFALGVTSLVIYNFEPMRKRLVLSAVGFSGVAFLRPEDPLFFAGVLAVVLWHFGFAKKGLLAAGMLAFFYGTVYGSYAYFVRSGVGANPESQIRFAWEAVFSPVRIFETCLTFIRHFSSDRFMLLGPLSVFLILWGGNDTSEGGLLRKLLVAFCVSWLILLLVDNAGDWKEMRLGWSYFRIFIRITPLFVLYTLRHPRVLEGLNEIFVGGRKPLKTV